MSVDKDESGLPLPIPIPPDPQDQLQVSMVEKSVNKVNNGGAVSLME